MISNTFFRRLWIYLGQTDVITDEGLVFESRKTINFFQIDSIEMSLSNFSQYDIDAGNGFMAITISNHKYKTFFYRSYLKIQDALSNIGGIIEVIYIIGMILCRFAGWNLADLDCSEGYPIFYAYDIDSSSDIHFFGNKNKIFSKSTIIEDKQIKNEIKQKNNFIKEEDSKSTFKSQVQCLTKKSLSIKETACQNLHGIRCESTSKTKTYQEEDQTPKDYQFKLIKPDNEKLNLRLSLFEKIIPFRLNLCKSRNIYRLHGRVFEH